VVVKNTEKEKDIHPIPPPSLFGFISISSTPPFFKKLINRSALK
jgi:hypothetical protein